MKSLKLFFIAIAAFGLTSCSSDDDGGNNSVELTVENIEGTYNVVFLQGSEVETNDNTGVIVATRQITTDTFTNAVYTFDANGTYSASGSFRVVTVETLTGQNPATESEIQSFDEEDLPFTVDTANRVLNLEDGARNVILFDGTNLHMTFEETDTFEGNTSVINSELRLVKQN